MNNKSHNGDNNHRQHPPPLSGGHPSLRPQFQQHFQHHPQLQGQDPQLAYLLAANAAAARSQQHQHGQLPRAGQLGAGNNNNSSGFGGPGGFGNDSERRGNLQNATSSAATSIFEEQILQRASALRAEVLMQQQNQQQQHNQNKFGTNQQQQLQYQAALQAFQQKQGGASHFSSSSTKDKDPSTKSKNREQSDFYQQQQEAALLARAAAMNNFGRANGPPGAPGGSQMYGGVPIGSSGGVGNPNLDRFREQLDMNSVMRHRSSSNKQLAFGLEQELERVRQAQRLAVVNGSQSSSPMHGNASNLDTAGALDAPTITRAKKGNESMSPKNSSKHGYIPSSDLASDGGISSENLSSMKPQNLNKSNPRAGKKLVAAGAAAAAAASNNSKTKGELRRNHGTVIVPCRARGMPMDHNFISAYFVISENAKHGENLICSYYACRNGGIKFRYCAYCMAPVAKRNFSRRHDHGMSKKKGELSSDAPADADDELDDEDVLDESESVSCLPCDKESSVTITKSVGKPSEESVKKKQKKEPDKDTSGTKRKLPDVTRLYDEKRRSLWNGLLTKRPRTEDPTKLSSWINEVLAVSDVNFPIEQIEGNDLNQPLGRLILNQLPTITESGASIEDEAGNSKEPSPNFIGRDTNVEDFATSINNDSSADGVHGKDNAETRMTKMEETTKSIGGNSTNDNSSISSSELLESNSKKSSADTIRAEEVTTQRGDGFSGSFADWRDRKKGRSFKKAPSSLRK